MNDASTLIDAAQIKRDPIRFQKAQDKVKEKINKKFGEFQACLSVVDIQDTAVTEQDREIRKMLEEFQGKGI